MSFTVKSIMTYHFLILKASLSLLRQDALLLYQSQRYFKQLSFLVLITESYDEFSAELPDFLFHSQLIDLIDVLII